MLAPSEPHPLIRYSSSLEQALAELSAAIQERAALAGRCNPRWLAIKLLERDAHLLAQIQADPTHRSLLDLADRLSHSLSEATGEDVEMLIADERYGWINHLTHEVVHKTAAGPNATEKIDRIVTHRWLGLPIFVLVMFTLFRITSEIPTAYVDWLGSVLSGPLSHWTSALFGWLGLSGTWAES